MTVYELKRALEQYEDDQEVRLATQPHWPFEHNIGEVTSAADSRDNYEIAKDDDGWYVEDLLERKPPIGPFMNDTMAFEALQAKLAEGANENELVVYISEADQLGYLPGEVSKTLGWK